MADKFGMPMVDCSDKAVIESLQSRLSAAEKERDEAKSEVERLRNLAKQSFDLEMDALARSRDEALVCIEKMREAISAVVEPCGCGLRGCEFCGRTAPLGLSEAIALKPAPAALSNLRQEIRREALQQAEQECQDVIDSGLFTGDQQYAAAACKVAIRRLAEEQEGKNG